MSALVRGGPLSERLDVALVARGLVDTRGRAQGLVMAGQVRVDGQVVTKAGTRVADDAAIEVAAPPPYVSRAGGKLATALDTFGWDVTGARALDLGASTGGFTDCLLQRGAAAVIAVDVGYGQLHDRLRTDPRVTVLERTNARDLAAVDLPYRPDLVVADVSFISLTLVLAPALALAASPWRALVLVKPQFEAGREQVAKGGVVRDPAVRAASIERVARYACDLGGVPIGAVDSGHPGPAGNHEYVLAIVSNDHDAALQRPIPDPADLGRAAVGA
jgi:23S rRNA (cytidine1920-2'-O)/16S rRNA (cytidine1409-2'-O)-methyltransferase